VEPRRIVSTQCIHCNAHIDAGKGKSGSAWPWKRLQAGSAASQPSLDEQRSSLSSKASGSQRWVSSETSVAEPAKGRGRKPSSRLIRCPGCETRYQLPSMAKSAMCPSCGESLELQNYEIADCANFTIRTIGDVTIEATGVLQSTQIFCGNLTVKGGKIMGKIDCSGTFHFSGRTTILGSIYCDHFHLAEGSYLATVQPVVCGSAEILGECEATLDCQGKVSIGSEGILRGDSIAGGLAIAPGGQLQGASQTRR